MKYFSMFTGVGGFELGIQQAYNNKQLTKNQQDGEGRHGDIDESESLLCSAKESPLCVGMSEIDKYASELLKEKFKGVKNYGDATKIRTNELPDFDMLCGGFPCQSFSIAGKRKGFGDIRGTMFFEVARILKAKRPKLVFLENVKGLLNHNEGKTFRVIIQTLEELGYNTQWMVLNSKFFGVPQNRERVFIIGSVRGEPRPEILPFTEINRETYGTYDTEDSRSEIGQAVRRYGVKGISPPLNNWSPIITFHSPRTNDSNKGGSSPLTSDKHCFTIDRTPHYVHRTPLKFLERNQKNIERDYAFTVDSANTGGGHLPKIAHTVQVGTITEAQGRQGSSKEFLSACEKINQTTGQIRRLTPLECERLQGFPEGWTEGFSDTQRYKMMGNAVTVNVIRVLAEKLI